MKKSVLITNSGINQNTGGGIVSYNLLKALQSCTDVQYILASQKFPETKYENINAYSINPADYNYNADPFSMDYLAYHLLPDEKIDLVQTYACPFGLTVEELKRKGSKIIADVAPHNLELSQEEHMKHAGQYPYPHLTEEMLWGIYSRNLRLSDVVIVHSRSSAEYIQKKANLRDLPAVIPHGVNLPATIPEYPEKFTPGYFGAPGFDKGLFYLCRAWMQMFTTNTSLDSQLYFGGQGWQSLEKDGEFWFGAFHMPLQYKKYFNITGYVPNISDFYRQINVYIQPSVTEGFGLTPLEAMAYGRPVIVTTGTGVADLIEDGVQGFIVPIKNEEAIKGRLQYFMDNPNEITRMGAEARKRAEQYEWKKIREQYVSIYNRF